MVCAVCRRSDALFGVLCEDCRDDVSAPLGMVLEQILSTVLAPTDAALIDAWGRPHALESRVMIGRTIDRTGLLILEASVSRHHAHLALERGSWVIRDLGSANQTFVNEGAITGSTSLEHGDRIGIGHVDFYFVLGAADLPSVTLDPATITTVQPIERAARLRNMATPDDATTEHPVSELHDFVDTEDTDVGLTSVRLRLVEPTGGGGGMLEVEGVHLQLTAIQCELLALLIRRMTEEGHQAAQVRGFVRSSQLLGELSWDTPSPTDNHLKQLIRRVRRALVRSGIGDLLESQHGFGYRLRVIPLPPAT